MTFQRGLPIVVVLLGLSSPVRAAEPTAAAPTDPAAEAARRRELATRAYSIQDFVGAASEYRLAYQLDPKPELLYAIAQAERLGGECERAILAYRSFLGTQPGAAQAEASRRNIERCETLLHERQHPRPFAPTRRPPRKWYRDATGYVLAVTGLVGLIIGPTLYGVGAARVNHQNDSVTYGEFQTRAVGASNARELQIAGDVVMGLSGALLIGGVARFGYLAADYRRAKARGDVELAP